MTQQVRAEVRVQGLAPKGLHAEAEGHPEGRSGNWKAAQDIH